jgi:hypothetical protein
MVERRWPTLAEALADIECDILDERMLRVLRPTPEERELIRAEAEAFLAERRAAQKQGRTRRSQARRPT